jgi:hypothetical protein
MLFGTRPVSLSPTLTRRTRRAENGVPELNLAETAEGAPGARLPNA